MKDPVALLVMRYALPCADIALQEGRISQEEYDALEAALKVGEALPQPLLERFFPALVARMEEVAAEEHCAYWSERTVRLYFYKYHDHYIDRGHGNLARMSATEKELCRARIGEVLGVVNDEPRVLEVALDGERVRVLGTYAPEAGAGDIVGVHRRFATEKLDAETAAAFGYPRS